MANEDIKKQFKLRDKLIRVLSKDGSIRVSALKNTISAQQAQSRHNLSYVAATLLAKQLSAASLLASFLKGEERIILDIQGNGIIAQIYSEALQLGEVRGFVRQKEAIDATNLTNLSDALGIGLLKVTKFLYNRSEPIQGIVPLQVGDIESDIAYYLSQSEQIASAVILDASLDDTGNILESGGIIVQAMPDADPEMLEHTVNQINDSTKITDMLAREMMPEDILHDILPFEFDIVKTAQVDFYCRCTKDTFMKKIITLGLAEIRAMKEDKNNELTCHYCNEHYYLDDDDFLKLIADSQAKRN